MATLYGFSQVASIITQSYCHLITTTYELSCNSALLVLTQYAPKPSKIKVLALLCQVLALFGCG